MNLARPEIDIGLAPQTIAEFPFHHAERRGRRARLLCQIGVGVPHAGSASEVAAAHRIRVCVARGLVSNGEKDKPAYRVRLCRAFRGDREPATAGRASGNRRREHRQVASERERWRARNYQASQICAYCGETFLLCARGRN